MTPPGTGLRRLAARVCDARTLELTIDPIIADLRHEYEDACHQHRHWRSRWILLAGRIALLKVLAICGGRRLLFGRSRDVGDPAASLLWRRGALCAVLVGIVVTILFQLPLLWAGWASAGWARLALLAMPQALPIGMLCGVVLGVLYAAGPAISRRGVVLVVAAALVCSAVSFGVMSRVAPAANYAYLVTVNGQDVPRGVNELTLPELRARLDTDASLRVRLAGRDDRPFVETMYYMRGAFAAGVLPLVLLALAMWRWPGVVRMAGGVLMCGAYIGYYFWLSNLGRFDALSPVAATWLPNVAIMLLAITWLTSRELWSRARSVPDRR